MSISKRFLFFARSFKAQYGCTRPHEDGELEDMTGLVTNLSGTSFTMTVGQNGVSLTFSTDANTQFNDGAGLATMLNTLVTVKGLTQSDGSLYAKEVEGIENANGAELEGLVMQ